MDDDIEIIYLHDRLASLGLTEDQIEAVIEIFEQIDDDLEEADELAEDALERQYDGS